MFSTSYFKYLIKSKKVLIIIISIWTIFSSLLNRDSAQLNYILLFAFELLLAFILPSIIFSFVHEKRAVDTYFSINISRKALLTTSLVFGIVLMSLTYFVGSIISLVLSKGSLINLPRLLLILLVFIFVITTVFIFNVFVYLECNNNSDGIIMEIAYAVLPFALMLVVYGFSSSFIYGVDASLSSYCGYLSTIYNGVIVFLDSFDFDLFNDVYISYIALSIYLVIITYFLYRRFINRKVERAGSPSSNLFSYPFIIYSYVFICIFGISCFFSPNTDVWDFINEAGILYLLTFIFFTVAHFIYRRKFYITWKMPAFFVVAVAISLLICTLTTNLKGFGLPYIYESLDNKVKYSVTYNIYDYEDNVNAQGIIQEIKKFDDLNEDKINYISISVSVASNNENKVIKEKTIAIINKYRNKAIDAYYAGERTTYGELKIGKFKKDFFGDDYYGSDYEYDYLDLMLYKELVEISKDDLSEIYIFIDCEDGYHSYLLEDGVLTKDEAYSIDEAYY